MVTLFGLTALFIWWGIRQLRSYCKSLFSLRNEAFCMFRVYALIVDYVKMLLSWLYHLLFQSYHIKQLKLFAEIFSYTFLQNCSHVLLEDRERQKFLKKMRSFKLDNLKKTDLMKMIVKRCTNLSPKALKCSRCGYVNGSASALSLDA